MNRQIIMIGRHGVAPQKPEGGSEDKLIDETVSDIYQRVGVPLKEHGFSKGVSFLLHSPAKRTRMTGESVLVGALSLEGEIGKPESVEDLAKYDFGGLDVGQEEMLSLDANKCSFKVYKRDGAGTNVDYWLANPTATEHEGENIVPYVQVKENLVGCLAGSVERLRNGMDFGVIVTHGSLAEPTVIELINSARQAPVEKVADIGGSFGMAEFAQLDIEESNGIYRARLNLRGENYTVDLARLKHNNTGDVK